MSGPLGRGLGGRSDFSMRCGMVKGVDLSKCKGKSDKIPQMFVGQLR